MEGSTVKTCSSLSKGEKAGLGIKVQLAILIQTACYSMETKWTGHGGPQDNKSLVLEFLPRYPPLPPPQLPLETKNVPDSFLPFPLRSPASTAFSHFHSCLTAPFPCPSPSSFLGLAYQWHSKAPTGNSIPAWTLHSCLSSLASTISKSLHSNAAFLKSLVCSSAHTLRPSRTPHWLLNAWHLINRYN